MRPVLAKRGCFPRPDPDSASLVAWRGSGFFTLACEPSTLGTLRGPDGGRINPYADGDFIPPLAPVEGAPPGYGLAAGVELFGIEAYQAVRVPLVEGGLRVEDPRVPLITRKDMFLRIYAAPTERPGRSVVAVVRMEGAGEPATFLSTEVVLTAPSTLDDPRSTLNVRVPGAALTEGSSLSVALVEFGGPGEPGGRFPRRELDVLELPLTPSAAFTLVVVPVEHHVDGLRRTPATDDAAMQALVADLRALWPVGEVRVRVRTPMMWSEPLPRTNPSAWNALLEAMTSLREADGATSEYYLALVSPGESYDDYCSLACIAGLAPVNDDDLASMRVAVALGFNDPTSRITAVHELGHALGRGHAPCGVATQLDEAFPHPDGLTGDWGWDPRAGALVDPTVADFMGYCEPVWISPHNYLLLHERISPSTPSRLSLQSAPHHVFSIAPFRAPRWLTHTHEALAAGPGATLTMLHARDAFGRSLGWVGGRRVRLSAMGFERVVVPEVQGAAWYELPEGGRLVPAQAPTRD